MQKGTNFKLFKGLFTKSKSKSDTSEEEVTEMFNL